MQPRFCRCWDVRIHHHFKYPDITPQILQGAYSMYVVPGMLLCNFVQKASTVSLLTYRCPFRCITRVRYASANLTLSKALIHTVTECVQLGLQIIASTGKAREAAPRSSFTASS